MSARDLFHYAVKTALQKEHWNVVDDPLRFSMDDVTVKIDLGAERLLAAERLGDKIAVEVKSFVANSVISDFHTALGQCLNYQIMLEEMEPDRTLFLAVPVDVYETFFQTRFVKLVLTRYPLNILTYDPTSEEILQWIH